MKRKSPEPPREASLERRSDLYLLRLHASALVELRRRGTVRTINNPVADYAETLFCRAFGWRQAPNSERNVDAYGSDGKRYQIKARRLTQRNPSRQLGALRNLDEGMFDILAAVLFQEDFRLVRAALIPHELVLDKSRYQKHGNSWRFMLMDNIWQCEGVEDVTLQIAGEMK